MLTFGLVLNKQMPINKQRTQAVGSEVGGSNEVVWFQFCFYLLFVVCG